MYLLGLFLVSLVFVCTTPAQAATPPAVISYQGKLLVSGASATTTYQMGFLIYDAATDGNLLYTATGTLPSTSTVAVTPSQGIFSIDLGGSGTNALTTSVFANNSNLYLEIWIGGQRLSPRRQLTAAPFALNAQYLMGVPAAVTSTSAYIPQSDSSGNFSFVGAPQSAGVSGGILYLNPQSATANYTLFGVGVNGAERLRVDAEGDTWISGGLSVTGTLSTQGTATVPDLVVSNSITLGGEARTSWPTGGGSSSGPWVTSTGRTYLSPTSTVAILGATTTSTTNTIFEVYGNSLFTSGTTRFQNGVTRIDGRMRKPVHVATITTAASGISLNNALNIEIQGNYAYITDTVSNTLNIVDISDPARPRGVGQIANGTGGAALNIPMGLVVQGNYAYIAVSSSNALEIVDISDPTRPMHVRSSTAVAAGGTVLSGPQDVFVSGNYLYLLHKGSSGLATVVDIIDISDPRNPRNISQFNTAGAGGADPRSIFVQGKYAYVVNTANGFRVIDVSNPNAPTQAGQISGGVMAGARDVFVSGRYAYVTTGTVSTLSMGGLAVVDISSSTNPVVVGQSSHVGSTAVRVVGGYAYILDSGVLNFDDGFSIVDITSSTQPIRTVTSSVYNTFADIPLIMTDPVALAIQGNYMYVSLSGVDSLLVIDISGAVISNADISGAKVGSLQVMNGAFFDNTVSVRGGLSVGNQGLIINGDFGMSLATSSDNTTVTNTLRFSHTTLFESNATSSDDQAFVFQTRNTISSSSAQYLLSVRNNEAKLFSIASNGDARVFGNLYATSTIVGTPGTPGDLAERVDILSTETVEAGDVVVVSSESIDTYELSKTAYATRVAGVISTNPTIVAGYGRTDHVAPLALVGRVPVKVSLENGPIQAGDMLVTASAPGRAMRYDASTSSGTPAIVGIALESYDELSTSSDRVLALLRSGWVAPTTQSAAPTQLTISQQGTGIISPTITADMDMGGYALLEVGRIAGTSGRWEITADGYLVQHASTSRGQVDLYAIQSNDQTIILSGSAELVGGVATVTIDERVATLISSPEDLRVTVSLTAPGNGLFISQKSTQGFTVQELGGGTGNATFDWMVVAKRGESTDGNAATEETAEPLPVEESAVEMPQVEEAPVTTESEPVSDLPASEPEVVEEQAPTVAQGEPVESNEQSAVEAVVEQVSHDLST